MGGEGGAGQHDDWLRDRCDARRNSAGARAVCSTRLFRQIVLKLVTCAWVVSPAVGYIHVITTTRACGGPCWRETRRVWKRDAYTLPHTAEAREEEPTARPALRMRRGGGGEAGKQRLSGKQHVR